jgi:uncharacterized protein
MRIPMIARAMTTQPKADAVEPYRLARMGRVWKGEIPLATLPRLCAQVADPASGTDDAGCDAAEDRLVTVVLRFFADEQGRSRIRGQASVSVALSCQRCLEPIVHRIDVAIDLWLVRTDEQASRLAADQEPFLLSDERVGIAELIEDDLLLALPDQVCASFDDCANRPSLSYPAIARGDERNDREARTVTARRRPFEGLAHLKRDYREDCD